MKFAYLPKLSFKLYHISVCLIDYTRPRHCVRWLRLQVVAHRLKHLPSDYTATNEAQYLANKSPLIFRTF